jgi:nitrate reductase molybdenum cofactor assembly chaperone NarJ/NarW
VDGHENRPYVVSLLADLIDYPHPGLAEEAAECRALVVDASPDAAALLDTFIGDVDRTPAGKLEEIYSGAFDLDTLSEFDPTCYPYVGHHLLGETYRRSRFMVGLLERYKAYGYEVPSGELPDHLLVMLRFIVRCPDEELVEELVGEALLPALSRMTRDGEETGLQGEGGRRIYLRALEAVRLTLAESLWPDVVPASYEAQSQPALAS